MLGWRRRRQQAGLGKLFETRSDAWAAAGLQLEIDQELAHAAARRLAYLLPALIAVIVAQRLWLSYLSATKVAKDGAVIVAHHVHWLLSETPTRIVAVIAVGWLGWLISRDLSRVAPLFFKRMDPATAGTVGFVIRLLCVAATVLGGLAVAGITLQAVAVGGAFTAVIVGLAAQQTLGNLFAGMVLLSARPFKLGELVHLQAGQLGGRIEGVVSSLGLLYTTLASGEDRIMIPNTVVLSSVVVPVREPDAIDVKVTLAAGVRPSQLQRVLAANVATVTREPPSVVLEEVDGDAAIVRVKATPERADDAAALADEIIAALAGLTGEHRLSGG